MWRRNEENEEKKINDMKKTYHLCLSAGNEAMFRDQEDYNRGFNYFALALYKTQSTGLVESFMSTHTHQLIQTDDPGGFMYHFRLSYCMYFNHKYQRKGKLGEHTHFTMEVLGYHHVLAAASYILRNPLHHGVAPIPYAYPHCSVNAIFRKEMGKFHEEKTLPARSIPRYIGRRAEWPSEYKMNESGVFIRESVLDIPQVENMFVTPRTFNFYMSRKSGEEWEAEQSKDGNGKTPISMDSMERGVLLSNLEKMRIFESGKFDYRKISDIDLCTELDHLARNVYNRHSVYQLTEKEKNIIASELFYDRHISKAQIKRCLAII